MESPKQMESVVKSKDTIVKREEVSLDAEPVDDDMRKKILKQYGEESDSEKEETDEQVRKVKFNLPDKEHNVNNIASAIHSESKGLADQTEISKLENSKLTTSTLEVISRQATVNIGTIGHVAHGKSTVVKAISGVKTVRFKNEMERNITIKLGYANAKIYKCENCPEPDCYQSYSSSTEDSPPCKHCNKPLTLQRHISFVDCPGHDILMATMLNGAAVMDAAFLLVAANEKCPQPQTSEHLAAVEIMKLQKIIILQNKVDLVKEEDVKSQYNDIKEFVKGTCASGSPVIPISAQLKYNVDAVNECVLKYIPLPIRDLQSPAKMIVIRSFDVNKPGTDVCDVVGGIAGGSILCGVLRIGDEIEVLPGRQWKDEQGNTRCTPIFSKITSLFAESNSLQVAVPGGLIGVGTKIDPSLCRADRLIGNVLGHVGCLPKVYLEIEIQFFLLRRLLGVQSIDGNQTKVQKLAKKELLMVNIGSTSTGGKVLNIKDDMAKVVLTQPVCADIGERIALSRKIEKHWRLIGWATILNGQILEPSN
eukprot:NODE_248_length_12985_cov_0.286357.p2 type:complete len:536 gc:universal NODE_248_length_12985_cov_0.286357:5732-4125(-)